jgi:hypothetical protein
MLLYMLYPLHVLHLLHLLQGVPFIRITQPKAILHRRVALIVG